VEERPKDVPFPTVSVLSTTYQQDLRPGALTDINARDLK